jgi:putative lipoic acid-binding regulatory protein
MNENPDFARVEFPVDWHGSLIIVAEQDNDPRPAIEQVFRGLGVESFSVTQGKVSGQGRYCAWQLQARISDAARFRALGAALGQLPGVKMLL